MRRDIKEKAMTSTQRLLLAYQTCQWWNAVFIQAKRFFNVLEDDHGGDPWSNEKNSLFIAERMFLITAIFHAIEDLEKLDSELRHQGDESLQIVLQAIEKVAPLQDIKNLRDMNEHMLDYLLEMGRKQDQYRSTVQKEEYTFHTTAAWTIVHGDAKTMLLGNVPIDTLLIEMKGQLSLVQEKTKEVFDRELMSCNNAHDGNEGESNGC